MRMVKLTRTETSDAGTFGVLELDRGWKCWSGELPWRDNQTGKSCIPDGNYFCTWRMSPKHGMCYHVEKVPDRTDIEIHSANFMGDTEKKMRCELLGCIAPGMSIGNLIGQRALIKSRPALLTFENELKGEAFELVIAWAIPR